MNQYQKQKKQGYNKALRDVEKIGEKIDFGVTEPEEYFVIKWSKFKKLLEKIT